MNKLNLFVIMGIIATMVSSLVLPTTVAFVLAQGPAPAQSTPTIPGPIPFTIKPSNQKSSMGGISNTSTPISSENALIKVGESDFIAHLSGKGVVPPIDTPATGTAKFHVNPNGTMSFDLSATNIDKVTDSYIKSKNNTNLIELLNPYATILSGPRFTNQFKSVYPTGPINGELTSGVITTDKFTGSLFGKTISDLVNMMKSGQLLVDIHTLSHHNGEIAGQILPSK